MVYIYFCFVFGYVLYLSICVYGSVVYLVWVCNRFCLDVVVFCI